MNSKLILSVVAAAALLAGCGAPSNVRNDPTYDEAAASKFVALNKEAINKLVAEFDRGPSGDMPVLVATIVNVNDMRRTAPLGRTLSEQYASNMAAAGFNVKEMKLRANMVLVGTYSPAANFTYVSLKFVRPADSRIIRGYDYALPNDKDVTRMLQAPSGR